MTPDATMTRLKEIEQDLVERQKIHCEDHGHDSPCWTWQAHVGRNGYGQAYDGSRVRLAHRFIYELVHGGLPEQELDHLCRVRRCVNPAHLEPVDRATNVRRGARSKLTLEQVAAIIATPKSHRALAAEYGVSHQTIAYYKSGEHARRLAA